MVLRHHNLVPIAYCLGVDGGYTMTDNRQPGLRLLKYVRRCGVQLHQDGIPPVRVTNSDGALCPARTQTRISICELERLDLPRNSGIARRQRRKTLFSLQVEACGPKSGESPCYKVPG